MYKIKPALYRGPLGWTWVDLQELTQMTGWEPQGLWNRFWKISKDVDQDMLTWSAEDDQLVQEPDRVPSPQELLNRIFVPAGWAEDVLRAVKLGAHNVILRFHEHNSILDGCPEGTLRCTFSSAERGFLAAVGIKMNEMPIECSVPKPAPRSEEACCQCCWENGEPIEAHERCTWPSVEGVIALRAGNAQLILDRERGWYLIHHQD